MERSGHSCEVYDGKYLLVFGGIYEITKELNDMHFFDFNKRQWITIFEESYSPKKGMFGNSPSFVNEDSMLGNGPNTSSP